MSNDDSDKKERRRFLMCVCDNLEKITSVRGSKRNDRWALCERLTKRSQKRPSVVKSLSPLYGNLGWADERERAVSGGNGKGSKRMKGWGTEKEGTPALKWQRSEGNLHPGCLSGQEAHSAGYVHIKGCFTATAGRISPSHRAHKSRSSCVPTVPL